MNCKKIFKALLLAQIFSLAASAFAVDFGGALKNATNIKGNSFSSLKLDQIDDLSLWVKVPFTKSGNMYLAAEGLYEFEYDQDKEKAFNRLDLSLLKFAANLKVGGNALNASAGRFMFSDLTGLVYNQNADGIFANYDARTFNFSVYGAYTGLLNAGTVKMLDLPGEAYSYDEDMPYDLAQKYFVTAATFSLPRLAKTQNLSAQFLGAFKVDGTSYNRMYFTASIGGPLYKTFYYKASTTLGLQSYDGGSFDLSNLSRLTFSWHLPVKNISLNLGGLYASGSNGPFEGFWGFTKVNAYNSLFEPQHTGIFKASFLATAKPIDSVLVYAGCDLVMDAATSSVDYKGFQYSVGADWQIFSDVKVGLGLLQYIDNNNSDEDKVQLSLNAMISF